MTKRETIPQQSTIFLRPFLFRAFHSLEDSDKYQQTTNTLRSKFCAFLMLLLVSRSNRAKKKKTPMFSAQQRRAVSDEFRVSRQVRMQWHDILGPIVAVTSFGSEDIPSNASASPVEVRSLENEIRRLMAYIDIMSQQHSEQLQGAEDENRKTQQELRAMCQESLQQRREEYERATAILQDENNTLREKVERLENTSLLQSLERENESLKRRLADNEKSWTNLISIKESQCQQQAIRFDEQQKTLEEKNSMLVRSVEELEATLRQLLDEKESLQDYVQREPLRWKEVTASNEGQLSSLKRDLEDARKRNRSLERLLEELQKEAALRDESVDEAISLLKHEIEGEKKKSNDITAFYSAQIDGLHQQLGNAMSKNKILLGELQRERTTMALRE